MTNQGVEAAAGFELLHTKRATAEFALTASTPWTRFQPQIQSQLRIRF